MNTIQVLEEMEYVEGGTFTMGATNYEEKKLFHQVTLSSFRMSKYEVTQALWEGVMGSKPSRFKGSNRPVENVSWNDVQEFLKKLNAMTGKTYRLPTEAEWEYAARGGQKAKPTKYAGSNEIDEVAWYGEDRYHLGCSHLNSGTNAVGQKVPNELGLHDMSGNVWEWCQDWYGKDYYAECEKEGVVVDPVGPTSGSSRVLRGGSWYSFPQHCHVAYRSNYTPADTDCLYGFRLVLDETL